MAERVGFVPVVPAPINNLGLIEGPQSTKSTQNLSIRYKTGTGNSPPPEDSFSKSLWPQSIPTAGTRVTRRAMTPVPNSRAVARTCRHFGISRKSFYKWKARYEAHGDGGICDRSHAPHRSPRATPKDVVSKSCTRDRPTTSGRARSLTT